MSFDALGEHLEHDVLCKLALPDLFNVACVSTSLKEATELIRHEWHMFSDADERELYDESEVHSVNARATRYIAGVQAIVDPYDWKDILIKYAGKTRVAIDVSTSEFTSIYLLIGHDEPYLVELNDVAINILFIDERLRACYIYPPGFKADSSALRGDAELVVVGAFEGDWDEEHDVLRVTQLVYMLKPGSGLRLAADDSGGWRGGGGG